ncbi:MAG: hypothetical protein ACRDBM_03105 [Sporomusa sp.]
MKLSNKQIDDLINVTEQIKDRKMPITVGLILSANFEAILPLANIYRQAKNALVKKHTVLNDSGEPVMTQEGGEDHYKMDNMEELAKEIQQAGETELEVNITKIPIGEIELFGSDKYDALTLEEVASLMVIVEKGKGAGDE